ncbi:MAG TPA: signal peptidase I [Bacillota bacterium]|jgi:signal peptidase|nr:signal peptidase I [Bacillota bacterium]
MERRIKSVKTRRKSIIVAALRVLGNAVFYLLLLTMAVLLFFLFQSRLAGGAPQIFGHQVYIVYGGSMSPTFEAGSVVIVQPVDPADIKVGDIITFGEEGSVYTTHRVTQVHDSGSNLSFTTRGDANEVEDPGVVAADEVRGRVVAAVPYLGYMLDFVRSKNGLLFLIIIPGLVIIVLEVIKIFRISAEMQRDEEEKRKKQEQPPDGEATMPDLETTITTFDE